MIRKFLVMVVLIGASTPLFAQVHGDFYPRPFPMGTSISTTPGGGTIFAGTAGMRVRAFWNPDFIFILSNAHVVSAGPPNLCVNTAPTLSTWVIQPGSLDLGFDPGNDPQYFGGIYVFSENVDFSFGANNVIDAGLVFTLDTIADTEILGVGEPTPALATATAGMAITKSGRTTGVTTGSVTAVNSTVNVNYGGSCGGSARFVGQITTSASLGSGGDSGSIVLESSTLTPVGLYFAGSIFSGVANPIFDVYQTFGVFVDSAASSIRSQADLDQALRAQPVDPVLENLKTIQHQNEDAIMARRGVTGMGIGLDASGEKPAFIVFTEDDPATVRSVPASIRGVPVRLVRSGVLTAH